MTASTTLPRSGAAAGCRETGLADLFRRWQCERDEMARNELVARFMPLARSLARRYARSSEPMEDLVQVASLGLIKALDRFDPHRGHAFASFAVPTILGELKRYFRDSSWAVHVPRGAQERAQRVEQGRQHLTTATGRAPTIFELAEYLEIGTEDVLAALAAAQAYETHSLDAPLPSENGEGASRSESFGDFDEGYGLVDDNVTIAAALRHLPDRERLVIHLRFVEDLPQSEIAARVGVSQMQVSRLLRRSLDQLRILSAGK